MSFAGFPDAQQAPAGTSFLFNCDPIEAKGCIQSLTAHLSEDGCPTTILFNEHNGMFYYTPKSARLISATGRWKTVHAPAVEE